MNSLLIFKRKGFTATLRRSRAEGGRVRASGQSGQYGHTLARSTISARSSAAAPTRSRICSGRARRRRRIAWSEVRSFVCVSRFYNTQTGPHNIGATPDGPTKDVMLEPPTMNTFKRVGSALLLWSGPFLVFYFLASFTVTQSVVLTVVTVLAISARRIVTKVVARNPPNFDPFWVSVSPNWAALGRDYGIL